MLERERDRFPPDADLDVVREILTSAVSTVLLTRPDGSTVEEVEAYLLAVLRETRTGRSARNGLSSTDQVPV